MKKITLLLSLIISPAAFSNDCQGPIDLLVIGDSQTGATWSKSYFGNFLKQCLEGDFKVYGKGGSVPGNWIGQGGMDQIDIIERNPNEDHKNIGHGDIVPACKKRLEPMIKNHLPKKMLFFFGDNYIASTDQAITQDLLKLQRVLVDNFITKDNCYFLTPSYEMEVKTKRNVARKNLLNTQRINQLIKLNMSETCSIIDGLEIMKDSIYYDGFEKLKRVQIQGKIGCDGAAQNDNIHICGEAAKDLAEKTCQIVKSSSVF